MHHFSRSHASTFTNRFVHISDRNDATPMHVHCHDVSWRFSNYCDNCYLASDVKCRCPRAQKLQLCTNFRGRTDRHLRGVSVLIRDQMAVLLRLCDATLCHQGTPRTALTICLPPIKKSWDFVLKRFNYAPFFDVARIVIYAACWSLFETKWRSNYVSAKPQCVMKVLQGPC